MRASRGRPWSRAGKIGACPMRVSWVHCLLQESMDGMQSYSFDNLSDS